MSDLIIACLSQKGGVGKSTLARLIARTYAAGGWRAKIADFNVRQLTSVEWAKVRQAEGIEPPILAEPFTTARQLKRDDADMIVADGKPDSDQTSLDIALIATLIVIPTGLPMDDLTPQVRFAQELASKGVPAERMLFVLNKTSESENAVFEARRALSQSKIFMVAEQELANRIGYQMAQNTGRAVSESKYDTLNEKADLVAAEIVARANALQGVTA